MGGGGRGRGGGGAYWYSKKLEVRTSGGLFEKHPGGVSIWFESLKAYYYSVIEIFG